MRRPAARWGGNGDLGIATRRELAVESTATGSAVCVGLRRRSGRAAATSRSHRHAALSQETVREIPQGGHGSPSARIEILGRQHHADQTSRRTWDDSIRGFHASQPCPRDRHGDLARSCRPAGSGGRPGCERSVRGTETAHDTPNDGLAYRTGVRLKLSPCLDASTNSERSRGLSVARSSVSDDKQDNGLSLGSAECGETFDERHGWGHGSSTGS